VGGRRSGEASAGVEDEGIGWRMAMQGEEDELGRSR
jgi:hypothetical protein